MSFERVRGFPSSLSTVKSEACWPASAIWGTAAVERPAGDNPFASTRREAAAAAERNVYLTDGTHSGPRLSRGIAEPDQTHQSGDRGLGEGMAKYVLAADYTLMTDYRNVPLATFFSCIPTDYWQSRLVSRILADQPKLAAPRRPMRA